MPVSSGWFQITRASRAVTASRAGIRDLAGARRVAELGMIGISGGYGSAGPPSLPPFRLLPMRNLGDGLGFLGPAFRVLRPASCVLPWLRFLERNHVAPFPGTAGALAGQAAYVVKP